MSRRHQNAARAHFKATDPDQWVSVPRAATLLDTTRNTVYNMIARKELDADHIAGRLVVRKQSLNDQLQRRAK